MVKVVTVRPTGFDALASDGGNAAIERVDAAQDAGISQFAGRALTHCDRPELTSATTIVSGSRGLGSAGNYAAMMEPLADKLGAALGASRAAVELGYVLNDYQVGQTR